ncbi:MAG TPA: ankyrin repeat domain-containing protein [Acidimicrobiia bacterium]
MSAEDLFTAIERGDVAAVSRILLDEPLSSLEARTAEGLTPIMVAAYWGQTEVLDRLLAATPSLGFWEAATVGATARVLELRDGEPDLVTAHSPDGFTALHLASFFGHPETVRALIDAGADVSARTTNALDNEPLHAAVAGSEPRARLDCARMLVEEGADVNGRQSGGFTPLMSAARNGDDELTGLLLARGANPTLEDDDGLTAATHAEQAGHPILATRISSER